MIQRAKHVSIGIERTFEEVYGFLADPENFPKWAKGLGQSFRHAGGMDWMVETPVGAMKVSFSQRNAHGIADHTLIPEHGAPMYNPFRVVRNGDGSEVTFTLFQRPGMTDDTFKKDAEWVEKDLATLKALLEG